MFSFFRRRKYGADVNTHINELFAAMPKEYLTTAKQLRRFAPAWWRLADLIEHPRDQGAHHDVHSPDGRLTEARLRIRAIEAS
jgi:hypothetical protein